MIYASCSKILNLSKKNAWELLQSAIANLEKYSDQILATAIVQEYYDGYLRSIMPAGGEGFLERVFVIKDAAKIVARLEQNNMYIGEIIFQIIASDDDFLSEKKTTLTAVLVWRIHPGLIEAPINSKQDYLEQILSKIQEKANVSIDLVS